ncbi:hypothetical protein D3C72_1028760 [compost metagenome]
MAQCHGRALGQPLREGHGLGFEFGRGHYAVDEAHAFGGGGVVGVAEHRDLQRAAHADQARQRPRGADVAAGADVHVGQVEARALGREHEVGLQHQAQPCAGRHAVHLRDQRRVHGVEHGQGLVQRADEVGRALLRVGAQHAEVAAGHEALARAAQQHGAHALVSGQGACGGEKGGGHRHVDGIERGRPVEAQRGHRAFAAHQQGRRRSL